MTVELSGVRKRYESFTVGPVTTSFEEGVTTVLGPSGSGKTTLLSLLAGFTSPTSGRIFVDGGRIDDRPPEDRGVGMVFQNDALFPHLTVRENLAFGAGPDRDLDSVCEILAITELLDRDPATLSGGEKQRVALARALVSDPRVLLLDEPLASLDAPIRRRLQLELRDVLADLDIPVVYVTHDRDEAAVVGDRLAILHDGEIVQEGSTGSVFESPASRFVADFLGMENIFPGVVAGSKGAWTTVDVGETTLAATGTSRTDDVAVAIHPEAIELSEPGNGTAPNAIQCRVDRVIDRHTTATVLLECDGLGRLTATVQKSIAADFDRGEHRIATVEPSDVHLTIPDRRDGGGGPS